MRSNQMSLGSTETSGMCELGNANNKVLKKALGEFMKRNNE